MNPFKSTIHRVVASAQYGQARGRAGAGEEDGEHPPLLTRSHVWFLKVRDALVVGGGHDLPGSLNSGRPCDLVAVGEVEVVITR